MKMCDGSAVMTSELFKKNLQINKLPPNSLT